MVHLVQATVFLTLVVASIAANGKQCLLQQNKRADLESAQTVAHEMAETATSSHQQIPVVINPKAMEEQGRALASGGIGIATSLIGGSSASEMTFSKLGGGTCLLMNGLEPMNNQFPGRSSECGSICSGTYACKGYSATEGSSTTSNNCIIWTDGPLQAGGQLAQNAECFTKVVGQSSEATSTSNDSPQDSPQEITIAQQSAETSSGAVVDGSDTQEQQAETQQEQQEGTQQQQQAETQQQQQAETQQEQQAGTQQQQQAETQQQQQEGQEEQQQHQEQQQQDGQQHEQEQEQQQQEQQQEQGADQSAGAAVETNSEQASASAASRVDVEATRQADTAASGNEDGVGQGDLAAERQHSEELNGEVDALKRELAKEKKAQAELEQHLQASATQNTQLQQSLQMVSGQSDTSAHQIANLQAQLAAAEEAARSASASGGKVAQLEEQLGKATHAAQAATQNTRTLQQQLSKAQAVAQAAASEAASQKAVATTEKKRAATSEAAAQKVKALERELSTAKASMQASDKKVESVQQELSLSNRIVEASGRKTAKLRDELAAAKAALKQGDVASSDSLLADELASTHAARTTKHMLTSEREDFTDDLGDHRSSSRKYASDLGEESSESESEASHNSQSAIAVYKGRLYKRDQEAPLASESASALGTHHHHASHVLNSKHDYESSTEVHHTRRRSSP